MPANFRGRNAATAAAVVLTIVLALVWLRAPDAAVPTVPPGLSVGTLPAPAPEEPAPPVEAAPPATGIDGERAGGDRTAQTRRSREQARRRRDKHADQAGHRRDRYTDRAGGAGEDDSRDPARENRRAPRQDPPATAPAPSAAGGGSAGGAAGSAGGGTSARGGAPEFALG